jgi:hypothetical protein
MAKAEGKIRTFGQPGVTESGLEVMAFHLHRFLAGWFEQSGAASAWVTLGFERSAARVVTFEVGRGSSEQVEVGWTLDDLRRTYTGGGAKLHLEGASGGRTLGVVPILDRPAMGGRAGVLLGYVLVEDGLGEEALEALQVHTYEAVCAARRNTLRLFLDERRGAHIKPLLYDFMEHLPEWTGCDYSSMVLLTSSLETMTLSESPASAFNVLAERVYYEQYDAEAPDRLVGMSVTVTGETQTALAEAYRRQREDPDLPYHVFVRAEGGDAWQLHGEEGRFGSFHRPRGAEPEVMVLAPLVARSGAESELIGFLALKWRARVEVASSVGHLLSEVNEGLSPLLRSSTLYTLSARKLWVLRRLHDASERAIARREEQVGEEEAIIADLIEEVSALISGHVDVPSFAIASMAWRQEGGQWRRALRYEHPRGWAELERLDLPVDVPPGECKSTGVSALAVRLRRPLVLAGGYEEGDETEFKNALFVDEGTQRILDVRSVSLEEMEGDWVGLGEYYKPVRRTSYATLAFPVVFCEQVLGVLSIEVDRDTNWLWWTGFGGGLFWELVVSELALAFHALGVRATPPTS